MNLRKRVGKVLGMSFLLVSLATVQAKDAQVVSRWVASPPKLDGLSDDWPSEMMNFEKSVSVDYAFRNDGQNLYILFVFKDPKFLSSIEATGLSIYANTLNKKNKDVGLRFLKKVVTPDELIATMEAKGTPLSEERKEEIRKNKQYVLFEADVINKKEEIVSPAAATEDVEPPAFRSMRQGKFVVYEFRIPLAAKNLHPAGIGAQPGQTLKIGFEWGGMTKEMREAMAARLGAEGTRAGAMDSGWGETGRGEEEGMPAGGSSPSLARMRMGPKKYSFWVDVKLAQPTQFPRP